VVGESEKGPSLTKKNIKNIDKNKKKNLCLYVELLYSSQFFHSAKKKNGIKNKKMSLYGKMYHS